MNLGVGTTEDLSEREKRRKSRTTLTGGKGSNGGKNSRGGNGGDDNNGGSDNIFPQNSDSAENSFTPDKLRIGMWYLMLVVLMTFGGVMVTYVVIATNGATEWQPFKLPLQIWFSTILILAGSIAYQISNGKLRNENQTGAKKWLLSTTFLGAAFISSQILSWFELVRRGVYVQSNPYAGFFYFLTALHALHVLGGIVALGYILLRAWRETSSESELFQRQTISNVVGWYWHFMGVLWIILFLLLGFWK